MTQIDNWEEKLKDLNCVDIAMYIGSVDEDKICTCGDCNQVDWETNFQELKTFIQEQRALAKEEERKRIIEKIEQEISDYSLEDWRTRVRNLINKIK